MPPPGIAPGLPAPQAGVLLLYYSGERTGAHPHEDRTPARHPHDSDWAWDSGAGSTVIVYVPATDETRV